jgi:hypothetical protein
VIVAADRLGRRVGGDGQHAPVTAEGREGFVIGAAPSLQVRAREVVGVNAGGDKGNTTAARGARVFGPGATTDAQHVERRQPGAIVGATHVEVHARPPRQSTGEGDAVGDQLVRTRIGCPMEDWIRTDQDSVARHRIATCCSHHGRRPYASVCGGRRRQAAARRISDDQQLIGGELCGGHGTPLAAGNLCDGEAVRYGHLRLYGRGQAPSGNRVQVDQGCARTNAWRSSIDGRRSICPERPDSSQRCNEHQP